MEKTKAAGNSGKPKKENKMGVMPIPKLLISMSLPMIISMIVQALYNVVDSIFVSQISENALTAVSLAFPIQNLMIAVASGTGVGVNALLSRSLGEKNYDQANKAANNSILLALIGFAAFCLFGIFGSRPFFAMQTDNTEIIEYGVQYMTIVCGLSVGLFLQITLERLLQSTGRTFYTMITQGTGAILNIIFDPILIFGYFGFPKMGAAGAALATVLSQALSAAWVLRFLTSKKSGIRLSLRTMKPDFAILGSVMALGISPFIMSATESAITIVMNHGLQTYGGDLYVGSMTILQSVLQLMFVPVNGFTNGVQPIISYNFGAGQFDRVRQTIRRMIAITFTATFVYVVFAMLRPALFAGLFTTDPELIAIVAKVLPVYIAGMAIFGLQSGVQSSFLGLGQAKISLFIALLRKVILLIPLALILPHFFGVMGVYYAEPIADVCSVVTAVTLFLCNIWKILSKETLAKVTHTEA